MKGEIGTNVGEVCYCHGRLPLSSIAHYSDEHLYLLSKHVLVR